MAGLNEVNLIGNLGRDPELRYTKAGTPVATLNVATTRTWKDDAGEKQEETEWHRVVAWGVQAENCDKYLRKGRQVFVRGRLKTTKYEDSDGVTKYSTDVVAQVVQFLGKGDGDGRPHPGEQADRAVNEETGEVDEDAIPF